MNKYKFIDQLKKYEAKSMLPQLPIFWKKAQGSYVFDEKNNKILDFTSTIFVSNIGHSNPVFIKNIKKALNNSIIHSYNYPNSFRIKYLKELIKFVGNNQKKAFLLSGGSETTECALKLMRLYAIKEKKSRPGIITIKGNWHGRTMGSQLMSDNITQKKWIGFKDPNIFFIDFPYPWKVSEKSSKKFFYRSLDILSKKISFKKDICGVMLESFQGWGAIFYPKNYVKEIKKFCNKNKILLTFDEMQGGFGRTGKKFGYMHYEVEPNIICCGKGMGSGFPLSGIIADKEIIDLAEQGSMSSTHSANPLACAAGLATLEVIKKKKLVYKANVNGKFLFRQLDLLKKSFPDLIFSIEGKGLIAAIIFKNICYIKKNLITGTQIANQICFAALEKKLLLVRTGRESIKIGPPLIINKLEIKRGVNIIRSCLEELESKYFKK